MEDETAYIKKFIVHSIENVAQATFQTDLNRYAAVLRDSLINIDKRLGKSKYLLGDILQRRTNISLQNSC